MIGQKLKELRSQKGLSIREVADSTKVDYTYISKIENGNTPSIEVLQRISDFFGVHISHFFGTQQVLPEELKGKGVKWVSFGEEMEKQELSPERIKEILSFVKKLKELE